MMEGLKAQGLHSTFLLLFLMIESRKVLEVGIIPQLEIKNVIGYLTGDTSKW